MNVKELKKLTENLPDQTLVGVFDHFGAFIEIDADECQYYAPGDHRKNKQGLLRIPNIDIGSEPD